MKRPPSLISSFFSYQESCPWLNLIFDHWDCNRIQSPYGQPLSCMYVDIYVNMYMWAVICLWLNFGCHWEISVAISVDIEPHVLQSSLDLPKFQPCFTKFSWSPQVPTMFWVSIPTLCIYVSASVVRVLESATDNCHLGTCPFTQWVWNLDSQSFLKISETHLSKDLFFAHSFMKTVAVLWCFWNTCNQWFSNSVFFSINQNKWLLHSESIEKPKASVILKIK